MIDAIVNELIISSQILHTNDVTKIAEELGYQPLLIVNALYIGDKQGKFVYVKKKDIIKVSPDVEIDSLVITDGMAETREQIELFIEAQSAIEKDFTLQEFRLFLPNLPELQLKIAVQTSKKLATYELTDPKDKESTYTFVTLKENADKQWGLKQLDPAKPNKASKHKK